MPMLIALFIVALVSLAKPFRNLALGLLMLAGAVGIGLSVILWRFWNDCRNGIAFASGRDELHRESEDLRRVEATFNRFSQNFGEPILLRPPVTTRGKESRSRRSE